MDEGISINHVNICTTDIQRGFSLQKGTMCICVKKWVIKLKQV